MSLLIRTPSIVLAKRSEAGAELRGEQVRLLPGGEVAALVDFVEMDELGVRLLGPAPRRLVLLAGEDGHGHRDLHALGVEEAALVLPVQAARGDSGVRQPVERDVVAALVTRHLPCGTPRPGHHPGHALSDVATGTVVAH